MLLTIGVFLILSSVVSLTLYFLLKGKEGEYRLETYYFYDPELDVEVPFDRPTAAPDTHISVVVPAYNEQDRISVMLDETIGYLQDRQKKDPSYTWEIVVVDDGSRDNTAQIVLGYVKKYSTRLIRLNKLKKNVGKGGAVRRGMLVARGKYLLMADADGATKFSDIEKLENCMSQIESQGHGVIVGSRAQYHQTEQSERRPWYRDISHIVFALLVDFLCVKQIKDTQCGFKLFTRKSAIEIFLVMHIERWAFDVEMLYLAQRKNFPIKEAIVQWTDVDGSHLSVISASIQMFKDIVRIPLLYRIGSWKIKTE